MNVMLLILKSQSFRLMRCMIFYPRVAIRKYKIFDNANVWLVSVMTL